MLRGSKQYGEEGGGKGKQDGTLPGREKMQQISARINKALPLDALGGIKERFKSH